VKRWATSKSSPLIENRAGIGRAEPASRTALVRKGSYVGEGGKRIVNKRSEQVTIRRVPMSNSPYIDAQRHGEKARKKNKEKKKDD